VLLLLPRAGPAVALDMLLAQLVPQISLIVLLVASNMVTLEAAVGLTKVEEEVVLVQQDKMPQQIVMPGLAATVCSLLSWAQIITGQQEVAELAGPNRLVTVD
jgi:hypothetical protein